MNTTYRTLYFILATLFIVLGSLTFAGCATEALTIESLLASPDSYIGKKVEIYGDVYTIEISGGGVIGKSVIVRISSPDDTSVKILKCEFPRDNPPPPTLKEGQLVTISGTVDIVEAVVILRECSIIN